MKKGPNRALSLILFVLLMILNSDSADSNVQISDKMPSMEDSAQDALKKHDLSFFSRIAIKPQVLISHEPILVNNDQDFIAQGWPGSGTPNDPFRIRNLEITLSTTDETGICINNTRSHVLISNCSFQGRWPAFAEGTHPSVSCIAVLLSNASNAVIQDSIMRNVTSGIALRASRNNRIARNICFNIWEVGADLWPNSSHNSLLNNSCSGSYDGIRTRNSSSNLLAGNVCENAWANGIYLSQGSLNNTISSNNCTQNGIDGICLAGQSDNNSVIDNSCNSNFNSGIKLAKINNTIIIKNNCLNNSYGGISLDGGANNVLSANICGNHQSSGISLLAAANNLVDYNECFNNHIGIYISSTSDSNLVRWNTLKVASSSSARDDGTDNNFHQNYWFDYQGSDNFNKYYYGPYKPHSDDIGDGIGDTYYPIPGSANNLDLQPLMKPCSYGGPLIIILSPRNGTRINSTQPINIQIWGDAIYYWYWIEGVDSINQSWTGAVERTLTNGTYVLHAYGRDAIGAENYTSVVITVEKMDLEPEKSIITDSGDNLERIMDLWLQGILFLGAVAVAFIAGTKVAKMVRRRF